MTLKTIISESQKYKAVITEDIGGEQTTYTTYQGCVTTEHEKNKYVTVTVIRIVDNHTIHQYKQYNGSSPFNQFVQIRDQEWWFGGRHYMLKLFVNCETGDVFDDPMHREESKSYESGSEFIWTGPCIVSPSGKYMMMDGCCWACPYETILYDISELGGGGSYTYIRTLPPYEYDSDDDSYKEDFDCAGIYDGDDAELRDFIYTNRRFPS